MFWGTSIVYIPFINGQCSVRSYRGVTVEVSQLFFFLWPVEGGGSKTTLQSGDNNRPSHKGYIKTKMYTRNLHYINTCRISIKPHRRIKAPIYDIWQIWRRPTTAKNGKILYFNTI